MPHALLRHTLVVVDICRALLTEVAEVVVELNGEVATYNAVPCILCITATHAACEGCILVEKVVHTDENLALLVLEELLTKVEVTDEVVLIVVVCKADILVVVNRCGDGEALPEYPLQRTRCSVIEVLVLAVLTRERLLRIIIRTVPLDCEVDVLRDVTTERDHSVVAHVVSDVELVVDLRGRTCPAVAHHKVQVTLDRSDGEAIAEVRTQ